MYLEKFRLDGKLPWSRALPRALALPRQTRSPRPGAYVVLTDMDLTTKVGEMPEILKEWIDGKPMAAWASLPRQQESSCFWPAMRLA